MIKILKIQTEFLHPKGSSLSYRSGLCRLKMSKCQSRLIFILICKGSKLSDHIDKLFLHQLKCLCHNDNIRIISHIAAGGSQVYDTCRLGALLSVSIYMAHHIVADFLFPCFCHIIIDILGMSFQFVDLFLCDDRLSILGKSQFHLCFCKSDPQLSPGFEFHIL